MGQTTIQQTVEVPQYVCDFCGRTLSDASQAHVIPWIAQPRIVTEDPETKRPVVVQEEQQGDPLVLCRGCVGPLAGKLRSQP